MTLFQGGVLLGENAAPVTPAADRLLLHAADVGGKTELALRDSGGAVGRPMQDSWVVCTNVTGSTIPAYSVVRATGASSGVPTIGLTDADALATMPAMGLTMESIANNGYGRVMTQGLLTGPTTTGMTAGAPIFTSGTAGAFTQTSPAYPSYRQVLGSVLSVAGAGSGILLLDVARFFNRAMAVAPLAFFYGSTLAVTTGVGRFPITTSMSGTITEIRATVNTAPTGAGVIVAFRVNGAAAFATLTIAASGFSGSTASLSTSVIQGDYVTCDITQVGSTIAGSDLTAVAELMTVGS